MNKKLFTQIKNEWRSNLWLVTELLLVSVVLWYIVDYMYVQTSIYNEPRGFDISHCYLVQMGRLTDKSPDFIPNQTDEEKRQDIKELLSRLQHRPDIEAAGLGQNSYPYNGSNSSASVVYDTLRSPGWTIRRLVSPDFVRVFRYRGTRGETPEQLAEMLKHPKNFLASDNLYKRRYGCDLTSLVDKQFYLFGDTTNTYNLAIALMKSLGGTDHSIFVRQLAEGLILLAVATIPAIFIDWNLANSELNAWMNGTTIEGGRFIITVLISFILIALMIVVGIWIPARKAMKVQPAEALHNE